MRGASRVLMACALMALLWRSVAQADVTTDVRQLFNYGRYDDVIAQVTEILKRSTQPQQALIYWRGLSALRIGWLGMAQADLTALGDYSPSEEFPPASRVAAQLAEARRLCPQCSVSTTKRTIPGREQLSQYCRKLMKRYASSTGPRWPRRRFSSLTRRPSTTPLSGP